MLARLGIGEIIIIVTVAFLIFGPQKLPELGKSLGETIRNFKDAMSSVEASTVTEASIKEEEQSIEVE